VLERHTLSSRRKTAAAFASRVLICTTTSPSLDMTMEIKNIKNVDWSLFQRCFYAKLFTWISHDVCGHSIVLCLRVFEMMSRKKQHLYLENSVLS